MQCKSEIKKQRLSLNVKLMVTINMAGTQLRTLQHLYNRGIFKGRKKIHPYHHEAYCRYPPDNHR
jgi:hypothetical protein